MSFKIDDHDRFLKSRYRNYVIYDVDYLLEHLADEIHILMSARNQPVKAFSDDEFNAWVGKVREEEK